MAQSIDRNALRQLAQQVGTRVRGLRKQLAEERRKNEELQTQQKKLEEAFRTFISHVFVSLLKDFYGGERLSRRIPIILHLHQRFNIPHIHNPLVTDPTPYVLCGTRTTNVQDCRRTHSRILFALISAPAPHEQSWVAAFLDNLQAYIMGAGTDTMYLSLANHWLKRTIPSLLRTLALTKAICLLVQLWSRYEELADHEALEKMDSCRLMKEHGLLVTAAFRRLVVLAWKLGLAINLKALGVKSCSMDEVLRQCTVFDGVLALPPNETIAHLALFSTVLSTQGVNQLLVYHEPHDSPAHLSTLRGKTLLLNKSSPVGIWTLQATSRGTLVLELGDNAETWFLDYDGEIFGPLDEQNMLWSIIYDCTEINAAEERQKKRIEGGRRLYR